MQREEIVIGSRTSPLALAMAREVKTRLLTILRDRSIVIKPMITSGDLVRDRPLSQVGGKGLFTREIEQALINHEIDIAVHSTKDMPTVLPPPLIISAYLQRDDARDAFVARSGRAFCDLSPGATIGTAALRRQALVKKLRPDLKVILLRGNVETRINKVRDGTVDGTFLALAGLRRLGLEHVVTNVMDIALFPPSPGQGAICLETREDDDEIYSLVRAINHCTTEHAIACERAFLSKLDGSCRTPLTGFATVEQQTLSFTGSILSPDGQHCYKVTVRGNIGDAKALGEDAALKLKHDAGTSFFDDWQQ